MKQILLNTKRGTLLKMFTGNFLSVTGYLFNSRLKISKRFGLLPSGVLLLFMMISEVGHGNTTTPGCINPVSADAGPATVSFCKDQPVLLHGSADGDYTSVTWTTDGDGSFSPDEHTLNVTYVPGPNDLLNNVIHLTLTANADVPCVTANDNIEVHLLDLPLASTTSNSPVCGGSALDMAAAGGVSYVWSGPLGFVNSTIDTTLYPSTPSQSGTYYVTVTDANGCSSLDSVVAVVTQPSVSFSIAPAYCVDYASVLITGNHAPAGIFSGSGITDHGDGTATFNPFTAGVGGPYSILYEYIDIPTGCYNSVAHDVTVNDLPLTSTTSNSPVCAGGALDMVAAGGVSYSWTGPNGFINSSIDTSLFPALTSESGTYYVTVTDANGCVRLDSVIAVVNQTSVSFSIFTAYCVDHSSVLITGNHAPEGTFSGPGITDLGNGTATFVPAAASEGGPYSILYQYTDLATGCSNSIIHDVTVFGLPLTSTSNNSPVCAGAALDMAAGGGVSYYWTGPNGFVNSLIDTTLYPATTGQSGTYYVRITDANGCSSIDSVVAVVHPTYDITLSPVTQCNSYILPWGGTITLTDDYTSSTYATVNGCDSIIHQHVTINYTSSSYDTVNVCNSYTWNSNTYTTSGDHNAGPFTNAAGCDSIAYLHLIIRYSSSSHDTVSVCNSYTWNSNTYTTSGDHNAGPFTNAAGCDSIAYLHLIIRYSSSSTVNISFCFGGSYTPPNGTPMTVTGTQITHISNATGCDSAITTSLTVINCVTLNIKAFIQCYYKGSSSMKHVLLNEIVPGSLPYQVDTIVVELHDTVTGSHALLESYKGIIDTTGSLSCVFSNSVLGKYSYIVIRHRNTIETWSANPVTINPVNSYDFTTAATKAYGSNMIDVFGEGIWSFYNADFPQDGIIEASDLNAMEADLVALAVGYYATDVDGDGFVDASDLNFLEANVLRVVQRHHP